MELKLLKAILASYIIMAPGIAGLNFGYAGEAPYGRHLGQPYSLHSNHLYKAPVTDLRCVGCGHCVDICPTEPLKYSTRFLRARV